MRSGNDRVALPMTVLAGLLVATQPSCSKNSVVADLGGLRFVGEPSTRAEYNRNWTYRVVVAHPRPDGVSLDAPLLPAWMRFDADERVLRGTPGWDGLGSHRVRLEASDDRHRVEQSFVVTVEKGEIICGQDFGDPAASEYDLPFGAGESYPIIQGYCPPNPRWGHHNWFAYDFAMPIGTTVVASRAGTVTTVVEQYADDTGVCGQSPSLRILQSIRTVSGGDLDDLETDLRGGRLKEGNLMKLERLTLILLVVGASTTACGGGGDPGLLPPSRGLRFDSQPVTQSDHNRDYAYQATASGVSTSISATRLPSWMQFDTGTRTLSGIAGWDNVGLHGVRLEASDGTDMAVQAFTVRVDKGEIICDQEFGDPAQSLYVLPYEVGRTFENFQGNCPTNPNWGHFNMFAYDFDLPTGTDVLATRAGTVGHVFEEAPNVGDDCSPGKTNFFVITHADGTSMLYAHMITNGVLVSVGEEVTQGQVVAISGNSGCSSGPHLHVQLHREPNDYGRKATLPFNFRNADGPLEPNHGLVQTARYTALPFTPDGR